jgi:hypothetical protein
MFGKKTPFKVVSIIKDVTDPDISNEEPANIVNEFGINDEVLYEGLVFRGTLISSEDRPVTQLTIKPVNYLFAEQFDRAEKMRTFRANIATAITNLEALREPPKRRSLVIKTLAKEVIAVSQIDGKEKVMLVMSDLLESSQSFSFYSSRDLIKAKLHPEKVAEQFQKIAPLPSTKGIKVYLIYQATNYEAQLQ